MVGRDSKNSVIIASFRTTTPVSAFAPLKAQPGKIRTGGHIEITPHSILEYPYDICSRARCLTERVLSRRLVAEAKHSKFVDANVTVSKNVIRLRFDRENSARPDEKVIDVRLIYEQIIKRDVPLAPELSE